MISQVAPIDRRAIRLVFKVAPELYFYDDCHFGQGVSAISGSDHGQNSLGGIETDLCYVFESRSAESQSQPFSSLCPKPGAMLLRWSSKMHSVTRGLTSLAASSGHQHHQVMAFDVLPEPV